MERFLRVIDRVSEITGRMASILVIILTIAICYDIFMRYVFAKPSFWAYDMTIMLYGSFAILGAAYCHYLKGHVRMDLIYGKLSPRGKAIADIVGYLLLFFPLMSVLVYKCGEHAIWSMSFGERSSASAWRPYLGPFKLIIAYGLALFLVQGIADFLRRIAVAVTGVEHES